MLHSSRIQTPSELCSQPDGIVLYSGSISPDGRGNVVRLDLGEYRPTPLPTRTDLKKLSFNGFSWGTCSPGAGQLALALLCDVLGNDSRAVRLCSYLCDLVIRNLSSSASWILTDRDVRLAVESVERTMKWNWVEQRNCYADEISL
jgi:hypothetical protein